MKSKINMKAKAWILTLFVCLIGFAGFGNTTTDLIQNSTTVEVSRDNSDNVVILASFTEDILNSSNIDIPDIEFESSKNKLLVKNFQGCLVVKDILLGPSQKFFYLTYKNYSSPPVIKNSRNARDSLNNKVSFFS